MSELRLNDLNPVYQDTKHGLSFQCPSCRKGIVSITLKEGAAAPPAHGCDRLPPNFATISITPSIAAEGTCRRCFGWHGFITNGKVQ